MTIPTLMNCQHNPDGWCLDCVQKLEQKKEKYRLGFIKLLDFILEDLRQEKEELVLKDGKLKNFMPKIDGKFFRCSCGCNVFHKPNKSNLSSFECNSCGERYKSE